MLKKLTIKNLVLIPFVEISFSKGLNIITGESGAGKSVILSALALIFGSRRASSKIRKGCDLAIIEAEFILKTTPSLIALFQEIPFEEHLIIRREIRATQSRIFINEQQISLSFLKKLGDLLSETIDQNASYEFQETTQRKLLDSFAHLEDLCALLSRQYQKQTDSEKELAKLQEKTNSAELQKRIALENVKEIEKVNFLQDEDKKLFQEHHLLSNGEELLQKINTILNTLTEKEHSLRSQLLFIESQLHDLHQIDSKFSEAEQLIKNARIESEEVCHSLLEYKRTLSHDPVRLQQTEERIQEIENLKKKYGATFDQIEQEKKNLQNLLHELDHLDEKILDAEKNLQELTEKTDSLSQELSQKRKEAAPLFQNHILRHLKDLNLPHADLKIQISQKEKSPFGEDHILFLFSANPGESLKKISECVSGGEMSRFLFAIRSALAEKDKASLLILDEIDSNVGGQTADLIGKKLQEIARFRQVICISHFVQVARSAETHFLVYKEEKEGRAITLIQKLSDLMKKEEYKRMIADIRLLPQ